jgi:hypothetical protein
MQESVTDANVNMARRSQWINALFVAGAFAATIGTYAAWENLILSALFLAAPAVKLIGTTVVSSVRRRRGEEDDIDDE